MLEDCKIIKSFSECNRFYNSTWAEVIHELDMFVFDRQGDVIATTIVVLGAIQQDTVVRWSRFHHHVNLELKRGVRRRRVRDKTVLGESWLTNLRACWKTQIKNPYTSKGPIKGPYTSKGPIIYLLHIFNVHSQRIKHL